MHVRGQSCQRPDWEMPEDRCLEFAQPVGRLPSGGDVKAPAEGSGPTGVTPRSRCTAAGSSQLPARSCQQPEFGRPGPGGWAARPFLAIQPRVRPGVPAFGERGMSRELGGQTSARRCGGGGNAATGTLPTPARRFDGREGRKPANRVLPQRRRDRGEDRPSEPRGTPRLETLGSVQRSDAVTESRPIRAHPRDPRSNPRGTDNAPGAFVARRCGAAGESGS